jgi:hypothetical protein
MYGCIGFLLRHLAAEPHREDLLVPKRSNSRLLSSLVVLSAAVSLSPGSAKADKVFDFSGACIFGCSGTATGVLTLANAYVFGTDITQSVFVSMDYSSSDLNLDITSLSSTQPGLNSDGGITGPLVARVIRNGGRAF